MNKEAENGGPRWAVETVRVSKRLGGRPVLTDVDLQVPIGSVYGLLGANGAGKTTLLRLCMGWYRPDAGEVRVLGEPMIAEAARLRQRIVYVGEDGNALAHFTVAEAFQYASHLYENWDASRAERLLRGLELPPKRRLARLSVGMRLQVKVAMALSTRPSVLLLDEPTNGLDPVVRHQFLQLLSQEAAGGVTLVLATHNLADIERMIDHAAFMYKGRIVRAAELEELRQQVRQVRAVLSEPLPSPLPPRLDACVWHIEQTGRWYVLTVERETDALVDFLRSLGAEVVDVEALDLEALFRLIMLREGYARDGLLLSESAGL
ncbi:ABC transporter ATP-binding protein [Alicyclobacillus herbarius]|uniref:ABC transporter ATP-binding protein n=1 Tax=Alicyclobacillus herbarius TaxID=122960 RepID=UPI0004135B2A|nr:ABC transporter ATP-binding protein [Alicyclobacillus herbarius]